MLFKVLPPVNFDNSVMTWYHANMATHQMIPFSRFPARDPEATGEHIPVPSAASQLEALVNLDPTLAGLDLSAGPLTPGAEVPRLTEQQKAGLTRAQILALGTGVREVNDLFDPDRNTVSAPPSYTFANT